jgi:Kyanoviridae endonuclease
MYEYMVEIDRVVDGDTVDLVVDLGFNIRITERFRLFGINAPESRTRDKAEKQKGLAATAYLKTELENASAIMIKTDKDKKGKYGRWLGTLWVMKEARLEWTNLNDQMVNHGHAVFKDY